MDVPVPSSKPSSRLPSPPPRLRLHKVMAELMAMLFAEGMRTEASMAGRAGMGTRLAATRVSEKKSRLACGSGAGVAAGRVGSTVARSDGVVVLVVASGLARSSTDTGSVLHGRPRH